MTDQYDEAYFLRGKETGVSLYDNYRWMPELTIPMVERMIQHLGMVKSDRILDFGCARGYTVKALRMLGYNASGVDISKWAIDNADEEVRPYVCCPTDSPPFIPGKYDWIIAKDVLEHIYFVSHTITALLEHANKGVFVVVPLADFDNRPYVIEDYEKDSTHAQRLTLSSWFKMFLRPGWSVEAAYQVPGIKQNWHKTGWEKGNGFLTARRIAQ